MKVRLFSSMMMFLGLTAACSSSVTIGDGNGGDGGSITPAGGSDPGTGGAPMTTSSGGTGGAPTTPSSGSTGGGAPYDHDCFACSSACYGPLYACQDDAACQAWAACATPCFQQSLGPSCWKACDEQHPEAAAQYGAVYQCLCQSCASACGDSVAPCEH